MARLDLYRDGAFLRSLELTQPVMLVGRGRDCDLVLSDPLASRRHFEVVAEDRVYRLRDLDTANGTRVNGAREYQCVLRESSIVQVGEEILLFRPGSGDGPMPDGDGSLPEWVLSSLGGASVSREDIDALVRGTTSTGGQGPEQADATETMAPSDLKRLQGHGLARTRPHLLLETRGRSEVFALDRRINRIGLGPVQISLGSLPGGREKALAEVHSEGEGYRVKAVGLLGRVMVSGRSVRSAVLRPGDTVELAGVSLEFRKGLESPEDLGEA